MQNKKNIIKWLVLAICLLLITGTAFLVCYFCGITSVEGLRAVIEKCGAWGWVVFVVLQIIVTTFLCFVPATSMTFTIVAVLLFGALKGFILSTTGVLMASLLMFSIGRFGGEKLAIKMVGEESLKKAQDLIAIKSRIYFPLMLLFPCFPDDALCMVAGMTKMHWWEFLIYILVCRTIGQATICFMGSDLIKWSELSLIDWFVFISVCVIDILLVVKLANRLEAKIKAKNNKKEE